MSADLARLSMSFNKPSNVGQWKGVSKKQRKEREKRKDSFESPEFEFNEIWSLSLVSETAKMHDLISDLVASFASGRKEV